MAIGVGIVLAGGALPDAVPFAASEAFAQCTACNPCAAACNPCNPCAAAAGTDCDVPRLVQAAACNPCAAAAACNPCAAAAACNPCAAAAACNPCAAAAACNPCAAAAACNPCAAAAACNPCAAAAACNPCAAAAACNPCNPCAAAVEDVTLTDAEATATYDCIKGSMKAGYVKSSLASAGGLEIASGYQGWGRYSTRSYQSATHGGRQVQNYANAVAQAYGKFEESGRMPVGSVLAKDSFLVKTGKVSAGPLFVMEKMPAGFNDESGNWRYTLVMPNGKIVGTTNGDGTKAVQFCVACHATMADNDHMWFVPSEYRVQ
ncbi:MAG: cytochrome P460 family protein [Alphaproteobacteria bacterium]